MQRYFADTWYFIALLDRRDSAHRAALRIDRMIRSERVITHDGVLTELLTFYSSEGERSRADAVRFVRDTLWNHEVVPADRPLFLRALDQYERRIDKRYSLVDCMSMVLVRERGINFVLTDDHHFRQEGFTVLSDAS